MSEQTSELSAELRPVTAPRLVIPDVLRGVAILAMLIAHAAPFLPNLPWVVEFATANINSLASPLFALVMGISAQLVWNRRARVSVTLLHQMVRGLALIALGVWMTTWGSWVAVVLAHLGILLIVGVPILLCRTRTVIIVAIALLVISDPLLHLARTWNWLYLQPAPVQELANWVFLGGSYRLVNLLPFFLLGGLLLRHGFRRDRVLWTMAGTAPVAYLASVLAQRSGLMEIQSGDYFDTVRDIGLVFAVYVLVVIAATARSERARRVWSRIFVPFRAWGQVALSLYLLHVGAIALWQYAYGRPVTNEYLGWVLIVPVMCVIGWAWWRLVGAGPIEWLLGWITGRPKRWRQDRRNGADMTAGVDEVTHQPRQ